MAFRKITFAVLFGIFGLIAFHANATEKYDIVSVEPGNKIKAITAPFVGVLESGHFSPKNSTEFGIWKINDELNIKAEYSCWLERQYGFWPELDCQGKFSIYYDRDGVLARKAAYREIILARQAAERKAQKEKGEWRVAELLLMKEHFDEIQNFDHNDDVNQKLSESLVVSQSKATFENVINKGHYVSIDGVNYLLENLKSHSASEMADVVTFANGILEQERKKVITISVLTVLGLAILTYVIHKLVVYLRRHLKKVRERTQKLKDSTFVKVDELRAAHQRRKVRAVMMDETIREMTRTSLNETDSKSKEVLLAELRKAIENGNHELANALESALKKS